MRVPITEKGEPLFAGVDVARALDYMNPNEAVAMHCKSSNIEKRYVAHSNGVGGVHVGLIWENDIYRLIMRSHLPCAEKFQDWVFDDVLPSVRKHGAYMTPEAIEKALTDPDTQIQLATTLKEERSMRQILQNQVEKNQEVIREAAQKVQYFDEVLLPRKKRKGCKSRNKSSRR